MSIAASSFYLFFKCINLDSTPLTFILKSKFNKIVSQKKCTFIPSKANISI